MRERTMLLEKPPLTDASARAPGSAETITRRPSWRRTRALWTLGGTTRRLLQVATLLALLGALHGGLSPSTRSPGVQATTVAAPKATLATALLVRQEDEGLRIAAQSTPAPLDALSP